MQFHPPAGWPSQSPLVRAVGAVMHARVEPSRNPAEVDHVWLTLEAGLGCPIEVSINTLSRRNREAGFDSRIRVGRRREPWITLPEVGVAPLDHFSYAEKEARANYFYEFRERPELEKLLLDAAQSCLRAEVIGTPYHRRPIVGLHQIHSRRASCAVPEEITGRDGAICFYLAFPREAHWLFFKFCGQP